MEHLQSLRLTVAKGRKGKLGVDSEPGAVGSRYSHGWWGPGLQNKANILGDHLKPDKEQLFPLENSPWSKGRKNNK